ncbi:MAG TPA: hypothetical protein V6D15_17950 [Oculatellaceae cyanobacterium]|jgi:hypothetical protein
MNEEIKANPTEAVTHEAQLAAENMATGVEEVPNVDIEGDYEASKAYSVSDVDRSSAGEVAAESATASNFEISQPEETTSQAQPTGNPNEFRDMAHDVNRRTEEPSASSDNLIDKAIEMGKPGK